VLLGVGDGTGVGVVATTLGTGDLPGIGSFVVLVAGGGTLPAAAGEGSFFGAPAAGAAAVVAAGWATGIFPGAGSFDGPANFGADFAGAADVAVSDRGRAGDDDADVDAVSDRGRAAPPTAAGVAPEGAAAPVIGSLYLLLRAVSRSSSRPAYFARVAFTVRTFFGSCFCSSAVMRCS
jgi:hypothetical protein